MNAKEIKEKISGIGSEMLSCNKQCGGVVCDVKNGRPPKCLYPDFEDEGSEKGYVVIGMNPGSSYSDLKDKKLKELIDNEIKNNLSCHNDLENSDYQEFFNRQLTHWESGIKDNIPYYTKVRALINKIEENNGPKNILWTEIVKCETKSIESIYSTNFLEIKKEITTKNGRIKSLNGEIKKLKAKIKNCSKPNKICIDLGSKYIDRNNIRNEKKELEKDSVLTMATRITCLELYLKRELNSVPKEWPIITLDKSTFEIITGILNTYSQKRLVIGLPHPTSSIDKEGRQFIVEPNSLQNFEKKWSCWNNLNRYTDNLNKIRKLIEKFKKSKEEKLISEYILSE